MARFVLDVANIEGKTDEFMRDLVEINGNHILTVECIDVTNDNQFREDQSRNTLTEKQISNFNKGKV